MRLIRPPMLFAKLSIFLVSLSLGDFQSHAQSSIQSKKNQEQTKGLAQFLENENKRGAQTLAFVVVKNDLVTDAHFFKDYTPQTPSLLFSASKSLTSLAIGAAFEEFGLSLESSICDFLTEIEDERLCLASVKNVLQMSSGLKWNESYSSSDSNSDVLKMMYGIGSLHMAAYVRGLEINKKPGSSFAYSSGDTMLLSEILKKVTEGHSRSFVQSRIFEKLGLSNVTWEEDLSGTLMGAASAYLTTEQMAAIGKMLLNQGNSSRGQIISEDYLKQSLTPLKSESHEAYGYQWWLNSNQASDTLRFPYATAATFAAVGHWGQYLFVIPEERTLIIRFGADKKEKFDMNFAVGLIRGVAQEGSAGAASVASIEALESPFQSLIPDHQRPNLHMTGTSRVEEAIDPILIEHALGFTAKNYCSCVFVSQRSERACKDYVSIPGVPSPKLTLSKKGPMWVESALFKRGKTALFTHGVGCTLITQTSYPTRSPIE